jgi:hypothetical protein
MDRKSEAASATVVDPQRSDLYAVIAQQQKTIDGYKVLVTALEARIARLQGQPAKGTDDPSC